MKVKCVQLVQDPLSTHLFENTLSINSPPSYRITRDELGHSVISCAHTTGHVQVLPVPRHRENSCMPSPQPKYSA